MMRETLQWILQKIMLLIKKKLAGEEYLVSGLSIKPARNNDVIKWDNFSKTEALSE